MQCGCPTCGILMTQVEKGLESACRCPECGHACKACLGGQRGADRLFEKGMTPEEWEAVLARRNRSDD